MTPEVEHGSGLGALLKWGGKPHYLPYPYPYPYPYPTLPYPTPPYPTLPYPTLPYPTLPYPSYNRLIIRHGHDREWWEGGQLPICVPYLPRRLALSQYIQGYLTYEKTHPPRTLQ